MSHPKADDAQLACAAQQGATLVRHHGTQARTTFAAPGSSKRRKAMPKSAKLLSFGLLPSLRSRRVILWPLVGPPLRRKN